jgi:hypothetical protein
LVFAPAPENVGDVQVRHCAPEPSGFALMASNMPSLPIEL